jgi:hypothetical protein
VVPVVGGGYNQAILDMTMFCAPGIMEGVQIPIACSLTPSDAEDRIDEWRRFLAGSVSAVARNGAVMQLELVPAQQALLQAVDLARREKACCGFFTFSIDVEPDASTLCIGVPADAIAVLDEFARLLPTALRP